MRLRPRLVVLPTVVGLALAGATLPNAPGAVAAPAAVVGAQTSGDSLFPDQGNGGYDVLHYDLDLAWAATNTLTATATITSTAPEPLSEFSLDLEGLTVSGVTVDGAAAAFSRVEEGDRHKLVVTPAAPVSGEFDTVVSYAGTPVTHTDPDGSQEGWVATTDGAVALNEPVGSMTWFPNNNTPTDKATFTTRLTVPYNPILPIGNRVATSTGVLESTTVEGNTRTFVWEQPNQQATYLAMVGIGQYTVAESDVALTEGSTHEWTYYDPTAAGSLQIGTSRGKLSPILKALEARYGTYPGAATGLVLDVSSLGYALETQDRPYFENSIAESTLIHELAHQWFGNAVSPSDWSDIWLNEGPATFLETQVSHELFDGASTQDTYYDTWNSSTDTSAIWTTPGAGFTDPADLFGSHVYTRGAVVLEALRSALGDAVFTDVMATWIDTYGGGDASTEEFIALAETESGYDLEAFFADWLYDTDKPDAWPAAYELSLASTPASGATVDSGDHVDYTLTAENTGAVSTGASMVVVDVADVVADGTLDALPAGVTRDGDRLTWAVPDTAVGGTASVTIGATLDGGVVDVTARGGTLGADCGVCASTITVEGGVIDPAPSPEVTGLPRVGQTLTGVPGAWDPAADLTYRWLRDGEPVAGATGLTYDLTADDAGAVMTFEVTGSREGYSPVVRDVDTTAVALGVLTKRPRPTFTGTARAGQRLTAEPGAQDPGVRVRYQWLLDGKPIAGATRATYRLRAAHVGSRIRLATRVSKPGYVPVVKLSVRQPVIKKRQK